MKRAPNLQNLLDAVAKDWNLPDSFVQSSDHPYRCRCDGCLDWWARIGPDPDDDSYGPFTKEEVEAYKRRIK